MPNDIGGYLIGFQRNAFIFYGNVKILITSYQTLDGTEVVAGISSEQSPIIRFTPNEVSKLPVILSRIKDC